MSTNENKTSVRGQRSELGNAVFATEATSLSTAFLAAEIPALSEAPALAEPSRPVIEYALDDMGQKVGRVLNGGSTDDVRPELSGRGEPNTFVVLYDGDKIVGRTTVLQDGSWAILVPPVTTEGEHVYVAKTLDGLESEPFTLNLAAEAGENKPGIASTIDSAYDDVGQAGELVNGSSTDDATPTLRGHAESNTPVFIYDNGLRIGVAFADDNGSWTFDASQLQPGEHVFTVDVGDGMASAPFTLNVTASAVEVADVSKLAIDAAYADAGQSGELVSGSDTIDATPTLRGHAESNTPVFIYDNGLRIGVAFADDNGSWTFDANQLQAGEHVFTVDVGDGVTSDPFTLNVAASELASKPRAIDSAYDDAGQTGELLNGSRTDDATPTLRGHAEPNEQVFLSDHGRPIGFAFADANGNWTFNTSQLQQGEHVFTVDVGDGVISDPFTLNVTVDVITPAKPVISAVYDDVGQAGELVNGATTDDAMPTLHGQAEPNTLVSVYDYSELIGYAHANSDGNWSFNVLFPLDQGEHAIKVVSTVSYGTIVESEPFVLHVETANVPVAAAEAVDSSDAIALSAVNAAAEPSMNHIIDSADTQSGQHHGFAADHQGGGASEPLILNLDALAETPVVHASDALHGNLSSWSLADFLQPAGELFADTPDVPQAGDAHHAVDLATFAGEQGVSQAIEVFDGPVVTFPIVQQPELLEAHAA